MMTVESRTDAAIVVGGDAAHGPGWAEGGDDRGRMGGECLHLGEACLEMAGGRLISLIDQLDEGDLERLLILAVGQGHEANAPDGSDWLLERHVGETPGGWHWHPGEDFLQPLGQGPKLVLLDGGAAKLAGGAGRDE